MALKSTIFKAELQIVDMDRHYYEAHQVTLAQHPSETDERMMVRLFAFARHANHTLAFGKGLCDTDEPDLWQKDLTGAIQLWIEVGLPDEKHILKACGRANHVVIYSYGRKSEQWWSQMSARLARTKNLTVMNIAVDSSLALAALAERTMQLQCTIQDGHTWLSKNSESVDIVLTAYKSSEMQ